MVKRRTPRLHISADLPFPRTAPPSMTSGAPYLISVYVFVCLCVFVYVCMCVCVCVCVWRGRGTKD